MRINSDMKDIPNLLAQNDLDFSMVAIKLLPSLFAICVFFEKNIRWKTTQVVAGGSNQITLPEPLFCPRKSRNLWDF